MFMPKENVVTSTSINIAPLMDVMTIILIFLLVNFSVQDSSYDAPKELRLPVSSSLSPPRDSIHLVLSKKELLLGCKVVAHLSGQEFWPEELNDAGIIQPLMSRLRESAKQAREAGGSAADGVGRSPVFFQAHEELPFGLLGQVMRTAAMSGFRDIHLAVFNPDT